MNAETLLVVDSALRNSLIVFLGLFALFLSYSLFRLRRRKKTLARYFEQELARRFEEDLEGQPTSSEDKDHFEPALSRWRAAFRSLLLSLTLTVFFFLLFSFAPVPFIHNLATQRSWNAEPLRLTSLRFERFYEGFSLEGEVWNQTREPIDSLQAVITVWDHNRDTLDKKLVSVNPQPLPSGKAGAFSLRYEENSPFLYGYQVEFIDGKGALIPHVEGFDVR